MDEGTFTGAHPTNREFHDQLLTWGFTQRREDGVHLVLRGPHGGTLRILRSLTGRRMRSVTPSSWRRPPDSPK